MFVLSGNGEHTNSGCKHSCPSMLYKDFREYWLGHLQIAALGCWKGVY